MRDVIASLFYWTGVWVWTGVAILLATLLVWRLLEKWCPVKAKPRCAPSPTPVAPIPDRCAHARQMLDSELGDLVYRCLDCGTTTALGHIFPSAYCHRRPAA